MSKKKKQTIELTIEDFPYKIKLQHDPSGIVIAAGTDDIDQFTEGDLMKMVEAFKERIIESTKPVWPDESKTEVK